MTNAEEQRKERIIKWTDQGIGHDTDQYEDQLYWGFWTRVGGEMSYPPTAIFETEKEAESYAEFIAKRDELQEWHVGPCVLTITARDNYQVPE